jgi:hypothetical protein
MPFAEVVEASTVIFCTVKKGLKLFFVLRRVPYEFRHGAAALLDCRLDDFECVAADVLREKNATRLALSTFTKFQSDCFGDTSW